MVLIMAGISAIGPKGLSEFSTNSFLGKVHQLSKRGYTVNPRLSEPHFS